MYGYTQTQSGFKSFEPFMNSIRMSLKMLKFVFVTSLVFQVGFLIVYSAVKIENREVYLIYKYYQSKILCSLGEYASNLKIDYLHFEKIYLDNGEIEEKLTLYDDRYTAQEIYDYLETDMYSTISEIKRKVSKGLLYSFVAWMFVPFGIYQFRKNATRERMDKYKKGAMILEDRQLKKLLSKRSRILFGDRLKMPIDMETQHTLIVGGPGTGKSIFFTEAINTAIQSEQPCVVYDFKGEFPKIFYRTGSDKLMNPRFKDRINWNLFNEIREPHDIDSIAASLIPDPPHGKDIFWSEGARDVFRSILRYCIYEGKTTHEELWEVLKIGTGSLSDLAHLLKDVPDAESGYGRISADKKSGPDIYSTLMQHANTFQIMAQMDGDFSIRKWVENPKGNIFIPNYAEQKETLKPILSLFIDILGRSILSLPDDINRRFFLFFDEFASLQKLSTIMDLLAGGRSKGASCFLGVQDIGQVESIYGRENRQTLVTSCGTTLLFRVTDSQTTQYFSNKFGKVVLEKSQETTSMGVVDFRDGVSVVKQEKVEPLILDSEISGQKTCRAILQFPGFPVTNVRWFKAENEDKLKKAISKKMLNFKHKNDFEIDSMEIRKKKDTDKTGAEAPQKEVETISSKVSGLGVVKKKGNGERDR